MDAMVKINNAPVRENFLTVKSGEDVSCIVRHVPRTILCEARTQHSAEKLSRGRLGHTRQSI